MSNESSSAVLVRPRHRKRARRAVVTTPAVAPITAVSAPSVEAPEEPTSYWPLLRASMAAALLTLVAQCVSAVWMALQAGHDVSLGLWKVIPYLRISTTSLADFNSLVFWSGVVTSIVLALFASIALLRSNALQTQLGRSFAFLDISLIGLLAMASALWSEQRQGLSTWMFNLALGGMIAFVVAAWLVNDRLKEREASEGQDAIDPVGGDTA